MTIAEIVEKLISKKIDYVYSQPPDHKADKGDLLNLQSQLIKSLTTFIKAEIDEEKSKSKWYEQPCNEILFRFIGSKEGDEK